MTSVMDYRLEDACTDAHVLLVGDSSPINPSSSQEFNGIHRERIAFSLIQFSFLGLYKGLLLLKAYRNYWNQNNAGT
jgi:hypothetical protein